MRLPARQHETMASEGREVTEQTIWKQRRFTAGKSRPPAGVADHVISILVRRSAVLVADSISHFSTSVSHELSMSKQIKRLLIGSMIASGLVAVTAIVDLVIGIPYSGKMVFDILFLISAAVVIYMGYETFKEST